MIVHISWERRGALVHVSTKSILISSNRITIYIVGFYYPLFYLQLESTMHGLSKTFSFYSVEFHTLLTSKIAT